MRLQDFNGNNILHYCILEDNSNFIDRIIEKEIDLNMTNIYGKTVLHLIVENFNDSFFIQPLFEWTPNPFTIFYIGGNQDLNKNTSKYFVDSSQVFIKFQYLISL